MKQALISGCTGQIGSYLCDLLLEKNWNVVGIKRRSSSLNTERLNHIFNNPNLKLEYGDITDYASISNLVSSIKPDIFINCGAQSHVRVSFDIPINTFEATGTSVINCLEAVKNFSPKTRFITMSSSEMYGGINCIKPYDENSEFNPRSIYAVAKLAGHYSTINYREAYNLFACCGIVFNTESPRRGETFVTKKISRAATRISLGLQDFLYLGNLTAQRDWQHAKDTAEAIYTIVNSDTPQEYVVASGETHSVEKFAEIVFKKLGMNYKNYVKFDPRLLRPTEVEKLQGNSSKLYKTLGWQPKISFEQLVDEMIEYDLRLARQEKLIKDCNININA